MNAAIAASNIRPVIDKQAAGPSAPVVRKFHGHCRDLGLSGVARYTDCGSYDETVLSTFGASSWVRAALLRT